MACWSQPGVAVTLGHATQPRRADRPFGESDRAAVVTGAIRRSTSRSHVEGPDFPNDRSGRSVQTSRSGRRSRLAISRRGRDVTPGTLSRGAPSGCTRTVGRMIEGVIEHTARYREDRAADAAIAAGGSILGDQRDPRDAAGSSPGPPRRCATARDAGVRACNEPPRIGGALVGARNGEPVRASGRLSRSRVCWSGRRAGQCSR